MWFSSIFLNFSVHMDGKMDDKVMKEIELVETSSFDSVFLR